MHGNMSLRKRLRAWQSYEADTADDELYNSVMMADLTRCICTHQAAGSAQITCLAVHFLQQGACFT